MIYGVGIDVLEIKRLKRVLIFSKKKKILNSLFTENEINYAKNKRGLENLATTFTAKEALLKALKLNLCKKNYLREIEVKRSQSGQPQIFLLGSLAKKFSQKKFKILLSLTSTPETAIALVVIEKSG